MSVVEKFGRFIIEYQFEVEFGLGLLVGLIATVLIIKAMRNARKKRELLSQINDTVSEINTAVNGMGTKKSDVIYIDNRSPKGDAKVEFFQQEEKADVTEAEEPEPEETMVGPDAEEERDQESTSEQKQIKYFSRDCAMDKHGKIYTVEELKEQIKE